MRYIKQKGSADRLSINIANKLGDGSTAIKRRKQNLIKHLQL